MRHSVRSTYHSHFPLKLVTAADGFALDSRPVVVYGIWRIVEEFCYPRAFLYAEADKREYAQVFGERVFLCGHDTCVLLQQFVEILDKCREQPQESLVKIGKQQFVLVFLELSRVCQLHQIRGLVQP